MADDKIAEILKMRPLDEVLEESSEDQLSVECVEPVNLPIERSNTLPVTLNVDAQENLNDIELARNNIENIISLGDEAVREMVEIAKQSESPRAFEVVSTLMKTLLEANKDFVEISTKKRYAKEEQAPQTQVTNNNLIVSTADLLKMIKGGN
jgi:hypothetical protein